MTNVLTHGAPETRLDHSDVPFRQTKIANTVNQLLGGQMHIVKAGESVADVESDFGIRGFGPSILLGIKSLVGKTLVYNGQTVRVQESGTSFAVRSITPA